MTNTTAVDSTCPLHLTESALYFYFLPVLSFVGIVANLFNTIVFSQILKHTKFDGQMFKYLLFKSISDLLQFIFQILSPLYFCPECVNSRSYMSIVWYIGVYYYGEGVVELTSSWMEVLATFDCYCTIKGTLLFIKTEIFSNIIITIIHIYSSVFYIFWIFRFEIENTAPNGTSPNYNFKETVFYETVFAKVLKYLHTTQRDFLVFISLSILNILILLELKRVIKRKRIVLNLERALKLTMGKLTIIKNAETAQKNQQIMICLSGLNYSIGHLGIVLYYLPHNGSEQQFWDCFYDVNLIFFYISYINNIFLYYMFNKHFKRLTKSNLSFLFSPILKVKGIGLTSVSPF